VLEGLLAFGLVVICIDLILSVIGRTYSCKPRCATCLLFPNFYSTTHHAAWKRMGAWGTVRLKIRKRDVPDVMSWVAPGAFARENTPESR
jgi:hypothetical protein